jgi:methylenetetrahydrofolate reductase (NADPH)
MNFPFRKDRRITDVLGKEHFTLSAEIIPPRNGAEQSKILEQIQTLIDSGAEFLSVTKGAGGSLRGGSLPIAQAIKEQFQVPCIAHFTCRDMTPHEVENSLMDHHYFGVRNILALRGDPPDGATEWTAKEGGHSFAYELMEQISRMNQGKYLERPGFENRGDEACDFCIGAAVYPENPTFEERIGYFVRKVQAGARFGITDVLFDAEAYGKFLIEAQETLQKHGLPRIPILPGTRILRDRKQTARMKEKFKVRVPEALERRLPEELPKGEPSQVGLEIFQEFCAKLKALGAPGIHLFVVTDPLSSSAALRSQRQPS